MNKEAKHRDTCTFGVFVLTFRLPCFLEGNNDLVNLFIQSSNPNSWQKNLQGDIFAKMISHETTFKLIRRVIWRHIHMQV